MVPSRASTTFMLRKYYMLRLLVYATSSRERLCFGHLKWCKTMKHSFSESLVDAGAEMYIAYVTSWHTAECV